MNEPVSMTPPPLSALSGRARDIETMSTEADGRVLRLWKLNLMNLTKHPKSKHPSIEFQQHEGVM